MSANRVHSVGIALWMRQSKGGQVGTRSRSNLSQYAIRSASDEMRMTRQVYLCSLSSPREVFLWVGLDKIVAMPHCELASLTVPLSA